MDRTQTLKEELFNSISHGIGLLFALAALPLLIIRSCKYDSGINITTFTIFGSSLVLLYLTSGLYHSLPQGRAKRVFKRLDHCAIYILIAGTYTPFVLGVLRGPWGWTLFGYLWFVAIMGIVFKSVFGAKYQTLSTIAYVLMGWTVVVIAPLAIEKIPFQGLLWLSLGGFFYTAGTIFFSLDDRVRYAHGVWHLFVLLGSFFHFFSVYFYASPGM